MKHLQILWPLWIVLFFITPCVHGLAQDNPARNFPGKRASVAARVNFDTSRADEVVNILKEAGYPEGTLSPCALSCPLNSQPENEQCGLELNGGCSMVPPAFMDISDGDTVCGTSWYDGSSWDSDWYRFTVASAGNVLIFVNAAFDYSVSLMSGIDGTCGSVAVLRNFETPRCFGTYIFQILQPGTYAVSVVPQQASDTFSCARNLRYFLNLRFITLPYCSMECPAGAVHEDEPCGQEINGGCNMTPPLFSDLADGMTVCGKSWYNGIIRDTDWYRFSLPGCATVTLTASCEFPATLYLYDLSSGCAGQEPYASEYIEHCGTESLSILLQSGEWAAVMVPEPLMAFDSAGYILSISCQYPAAYCQSSSSDPSDSEIDYVLFNTIANNTAHQCAAYSDFSSMSTGLAIGSAYLLTVKLGTCGGTYLKYLKVFADWHHKYCFEEVAVLGPDLSNATYTVLVHIPPDAEPGPKRLRLVCQETYDPVVIEACGIYGYGETEDYSIDLFTPATPMVTGIADLVSCPGWVNVPVTTVNLFNVGLMSLALKIDTSIINYHHVTNLNPAFLQGNLLVHQVGDEVRINWSSAVPANIGNGLLFRLVFRDTTGFSGLLWNLTDTAACRYFRPDGSAIASAFSNGSVHVTVCPYLEGNLTYLNNQSTPLPEARLLLKSDTLVVDSAITNASGHYLFQNLAMGTYTLQAECPLPWGGGNALDGLLILKHFVGLSPLTGLKLLAADVSGDGFVNAQDATKVVQRFVNQVTGFPVGDWVFEPVTIEVVSQDNLVRNFKGLCFGDVDGSYIPVINPTGP